jgi:medium-chain acyl-[acyl-carrier-protein] hydrolase
LSTNTATVSWLAHHRPLSRASLRLFCFPYAGGSAAIYRSWSESLPWQVEVCPVQLPGRGIRIREAAFTQMPDLVEDVAKDLSTYLDKPFAFFGHSMGAIIGFELARLLRREGAPQPVHLFVSGRSAPQTSSKYPRTYNLPEQEFVEELRRINGTPTEVLEDPELMQFMLPLLRADFEIIQTYTYVDEPPLHCSITAFGGLNDDEVTRDSLEGWREQTTAATTLRLFPGDHFFINKVQPSLLRMISSELYQHDLLNRDR